MSSSTSQPAVPSDPPPDAGSDGDSGGMQRGASYFFGFLITFVVLLLLFVACGVVSRRRFAARRRATFESNMQPWAERIGGDIGYVAPVLLEKYPVRARDESRWRDLTPLAALAASPHQETQTPESDSHITRRHRHSPTTNAGANMNLHLEVVSRALSYQSQNRSEPLTRITRPTPYHRNPNITFTEEEAEQWGHRPQRRSWLHHLNLLSRLKFLPCRRQRTPTEPHNEEDLRHSDSVEKSQNAENEKKPQSLQIALLIEMPSPVSRTSRGGESIVEYSVGVANVPCFDGLKESSQER